MTSTSQFWQFLLEKSSGRSTDSCAHLGSFDANYGDSRKAETTFDTSNYLLQNDVRRFDNDFFGINSLEATSMDPQQRQLLEVVFECFENAGITLEDLSGAAIGTFVANFTNDFLLMQTKDPDLIHRYTATGIGPPLLANRLSYVFNLRGPSFTADTACSSSLYALHSACNALKLGECNGAIVAGANLIQSPDVSIAVEKAGLLSPSGNCNTFSSSADGYARAEAVGALFLKRVPDAIRDGDKIRAVIRGTATNRCVCPTSLKRTFRNVDLFNSNGRTAGLTQPSARAQVEVIGKAHEQAQIPVSGTQYVEVSDHISPVRRLG